MMGLPHSGHAEGRVAMVRLLERMADDNSIEHTRCGPPALGSVLTPPRALSTKEAVTRATNLDPNISTLMLSA